MISILHGSGHPPHLLLVACSPTHTKPHYYTQTIDTLLTDASIRQQVADQTQGENDSLTYVVRKKQKRKLDRLMLSTAHMPADEQSILCHAHRASSEFVSKKHCQNYSKTCIVVIVQGKQALQYL